MNDPAGRSTPLTLRIIHAAFMAAAVFYVVIGYVLARQAETVPLNQVLVMALAVAAVGSIVAGYVAPRAYWRQVAGDERGSLAAYQTGMIIAWACFEAVAIYGLVLTIMSGQELPVLIGAVVSLAFLASARPQRPH